MGKSIAVSGQVTNLIKDFFKVNQVSKDMPRQFLRHVLPNNFGEKKLRKIVYQR